MSIVFGQSREVLRFEFGGVLAGGSQDTVFGTGALLARGIGIIHEQYYDGAFYALQGAVIGGIQYGTVVATEEHTRQQPSEFVLYQNYPNPCNPLTTIRYEIPSRSYVNISVFDVLGRNTGTIADGVVLAGSYETRFQADNLASGVYFCRLVANEREITRKMIVQK